LKDLSALSLIGRSIFVNSYKIKLRDKVTVGRTGTEAFLSKFEEKFIKKVVFLGTEF
jgi:hypothetical protein